jgi:hypothetical protein
MPHVNFVDRATAIAGLRQLLAESKCDSPGALNTQVMRENYRRRGNR